jgi:hypothetical protein
MADVTMARVPGDEIPERDDPPGTFCWRMQGPGNGTPGGRYLLFVCPKAPKSPSLYCGVPIRPHVLPNGAGWTHDGNDDAPTLSPSVNCVGGCGWHGFIQAGRMTSV